MHKTITIYDEFCRWPYFQPYGEVAIPAPKKPRKPRAKKISYSDVSALLKPRKVKK